MANPGAERPVVRLERRGEVGVIVIDNPPLNAGTVAVRTALACAIRELMEDSSLTGGVLIGQNGMFMAGSDMREVTAPVREAPLPGVIDLIEQGSKPVVAAITGAALGGGYELALGCDGRIATPGSVVGLPECVLGMMPGAGGTQRLPRIVGIPKAISLICSGERVSAVDAARLGMIDRLSRGNLLDDAVAFLTEMKGQKRNILDRPIPGFKPQDLNQSKARILKSTGGRPHIQAAITAIEWSQTRKPADALAEERKVFDQLRKGDEAAAMLHLFFAERTASKIVGLPKISPGALRTIGVLGGTTHAAAILYTLETAGKSVVMLGDGPSQSKLLPEIQAIIDLRGPEHNGRTDPFGKVAQAADYAIPTLVTLREPGMAACVELLKSNPAIVGWNIPTAVQKGDLVELVRGPETEPRALAVAVTLIRALGKFPLVISETGGCVADRLLQACDRLVFILRRSMNAAPAVDKALYKLGLAGRAPAKADPVLASLVEEETVVRLIKAALANEISLLVRDGIITNATDADLVLTRSCGFARHEGGACFWAKRIGLARVSAAFDELGEFIGASQLGSADLLFRALDAQNI